MASPAPRILAAALLAFSLTACTHAIPASPHPRYYPPATTADPAAETAAPTAEASAVPTTDAVAVAAATPPPVVWVTSPRPAPKVVPAAVVATPRQVAPRKPPKAPATEASAPITTVAASTTTPAPAAHTGPYIDNRVVVEGGPCPDIYATGRTADGAPMKCRWDGDVTHRAGWEPL